MKQLRSRFHRLRCWLVASVLALALLLAVLASGFLWFDHTRSAQEASARLLADALAFSEYVTATLQASNVVLEMTRRDIERSADNQAFSEAALHELFQRNLSIVSASGTEVLPNSLVFVDASGHLFANSLTLPIERRDLSDLEYFKHHRAQSSAATWLSPLYVSHSTGLKIFVLSQRLQDHQGAFQGVLAITLRARYFEEYFKPLRLVPGQTITLLRTDGKPLFRYPAMEGFENTDVRHELSLRSMLSTGRGNDVRTSPYDGKLRRIGYVTGSQYPTLAMVSQLESDVFHDWRQRAWMMAGFMFGGLGALGLLFWFAWAQIGQVELAIDERRKALEELSVTESQLLQAEKLALLGRSVAVFAHDIGGPIGNAKVTITTLMDRAATLRKELSAGALRKSQLDDFVATATDAGDLVFGNLNRAANLLDDFKQTAMDQATSQPRLIELAPWLEQLAHSLSPQFVGTRIRLQLQAEPGLWLETLPGPLGQVISNLVNNARLHAFDETCEGVIRLEAAASAEGIRLSVSDDGKGMSEAVQARIFEPFFTTRAGSGGTGLGLHIVQTLVEQTLGGKLSVDSQPGAGSRFIVSLPSGKSVSA